MLTQAFQVIYTKEEYMSEPLTKGVQNLESVRKNTYLLRSQAVEKLLHTLSLMSPRLLGQSMREILKGPALQ